MSKSQSPERHAHGKPWHLKLFSRSRNSSPSRDPSSARPTTPRIDFTKNIPTNIPYPPFINVEGVPNFRDIGGYSCPRPQSIPEDFATEFSVRSGYVFRCSEHSQITPKGLSKLTEDLAIRRLYDLRSDREVPDPGGLLFQVGVDCISTPVFRQQDVTFQMAKEQLTWSTAPDNPRDAGFSQGYVDWYRQILVYGALHAYRIIFEHIRDRPDEPLLYHCTAGKDRTGVITAVILNLCGVDDETIAWEYSLTVPGMGIWEKAVEQEMVGDSMMPIRSHRGMTKEEAKRVCGSRASNMAQFVKTVLKEEFGGAEQYLKVHMGFTQEEIELIRSNLVIPGPATVKAVSFPGYEEHSQT